MTRPYLDIFSRNRLQSVVEQPPEGSHRVIFLIISLIEYLIVVGVVYLAGAVLLIVVGVVYVIGAVYVVGVVERGGAGALNTFPED